MSANIKFPVGGAWFCVEDGTGYSDEHPDYVTFCLRESRPNKQPGRRTAVNFAVKRSRVLRLALELLELADRMTPETTWSSSQTVGDGGQPPMVLHFGEADEALLKRLSPDAPLNFARHAYASVEKLRARMPVLRAAQRVLEHCDDETAAALHVLITSADHRNGLRFRPAAGFDAFAGDAADAAYVGPDAAINH
jgi:hypothetical protein